MKSKILVLKNSLRELTADQQNITEHKSTATENKTTAQAQCTRCQKERPHRQHARREEVQPTDPHSRNAQILTEGKRFQIQSEINTKYQKQ